MIGTAPAGAAPAPARRSPRWLWIAFAVLWFGSAVATLAWLMRYDNSPGAAAQAPEIWPADSALARDLDGPTLVMLAHPRCDCTRASLGELAEVLARAPQRPRAFVVFIKPPTVETGWEQSGLWRQAELIGGVTVVRDDAGLEAQRFGVSTSGQTLLYGARGDLLYAGGTTGARGKPGINAGRAALQALVDGHRARRATTPVFGCSLFGPGERAAQAHEDRHGS